MAVMIEAERVLEFLSHFQKTSKIKSIECFIRAEMLRNENNNRKESLKI